MRILTLSLLVCNLAISGCNSSSGHQDAQKDLTGGPAVTAPAPVKAAPAKVATAGCETMGFGIVGGETCAADSWVAHRTVFLYDTEGAEMCTATRIGPNTLVLAAHCVLEDLSQVTIGYLGAPNPAPTPVDPAAAGVFRAPVDLSLKIVAWARPATFNLPQADGSEGDDDDIALIFFSGSLDPAKIATTTIAAMSDFPTVVTPAARLVAAGFGTTSDSDTNNDAALRAVSLTIEAMDPVKHLLQFTTGAKQGTCGGDSGGPAYAMMADHTPKLVGVTSRSPDNLPDTGDTCLSGNGIDMDARYYTAWMQCVGAAVAIDAHIAGLGLGALNLGVAPQASCDGKTTITTFATPTTTTTTPPPAVTKGTDTDPSGGKAGPGQTPVQVPVQVPLAKS